VRSLGKYGGQKQRDRRSVCCLKGGLPNQAISLLKLDYPFAPHPGATAGNTVLGRPPCRFMQFGISGEINMAARDKLKEAILIVSMEGLTPAFENQKKIRASVGLEIPELVGIGYRAFYTKGFRDELVNFGVPAETAQEDFRK
jgi:hypothetical protein